MTPTADDIAVAIVGACRLTGEDPEKVAAAEVNKARARHYAVHALFRVFPDVNPLKLAEYCGVPMPKAWWPSSWCMIDVGRPPCKWYSRAHADELVQEILRERTKRSISAPPPEKIFVPKKKVAAAGTEINDTRPVIDRSGQFSAPVFRDREIPANKSDLRAMLAEAARNTAKQQKSN